MIEKNATPVSGTSTAVEKSIVSHPFTSVELISEDGSFYDTRRITIAAVLSKLADNPEDTVISIGESLCNPKDPFNKALGTKIAVNRANHGNCDGSNHWTIREIEKMVEYEGEENPMSSAVSPITGTAIPYGMINRIRMLIPRPQKQ